VVVAVQMISLGLLAELAVHLRPRPPTDAGLDIVEETADAGDGA